MVLYGLKTCDTCRKALKALEAAGVPVTVVDVRADGVPADVLGGWVDAVGPEVLVNTRSTTWRGLDEETRVRALDAAQTAAVLAAHPSLMKRPVIVAGTAVHVGWTKAVQSAVL